VTSVILVCRFMHCCLVEMEMTQLEMTQLEMSFPHLTGMLTSKVSFDYLNANRTQQIT